MITTQTIFLTGKNSLDVVEFGGQNIGLSLKIKMTESNESGVANL